jgi:hypothetical protein
MKASSGAHMAHPTSWNTESTGPGCRRRGAGPVRATSVNPRLALPARQKPYFARLMPGGSDWVDQLAVLGRDIAGQAEAVGPSVTQFPPMTHRAGRAGHLRRRPQCHEFCWHRSR